MARRKKYKLETIAKNFGKTIRATSEKEMRSIVLELLRRIVLKTPVKSGMAQANWQIGIEKPAPGVIQFGGNPSQASSAAITAGLKQVANIKFGQTIYISNNLPYILRLENGWSNQAPAGMVQLSLNELRSKFK